MKLGELIKQERFASPAQEAMLNILVTSNWISSRMVAAMAPFGITPAQFNVLRILRGSHPETLTCSAIGDRLIDRTPDVTRLLDRLEKAGLITRLRSTEDRRVVQVGITPRGLALLAQMDSVINELQDELLQYLTPSDQNQLSQLLERMRTDQRG